MGYFLPLYSQAQLENQYASRHALGRARGGRVPREVEEDDQPLIWMRVDDVDDFTRSNVPPLANDASCSDMTSGGGSGDGKTVYLYRVPKFGLWVVSSSIDYKQVSHYVLASRSTALSPQAVTAPWFHPAMRYDNLLRGRIGAHKVRGLQV
jgi:hypothetical protein